MTDTNAPALITTADLAARLGTPGLVVADATCFLPMQKRDARAEYAERHIPGAVFFDIDAISDHGSTLPHMLPTPAAFAGAVGALGIGNDSHVVVYDTNGIWSAPRAWWTLRVFGHGHVSVLDGGLPKWLAEGRPVDDGAVTPKPAAFTPRFDPAQVRDKRQVWDNIGSRAEQLIDARSAGRFRATDAEPWPGRRAGHVPGSFNLPFTELLAADGRTFRSTEEIRARYAAAGVDTAKPIVCSCGSGVTACVLALGLHLIGADRVAIYDGSWAEWGLPGDTPVEQG